MYCREPPWSSLAKQVVSHHRLKRFYTSVMKSTSKARSIVQGGGFQLSVIGPVFVSSVLSIERKFKIVLTWRAGSFFDICMSVGAWRQKKNTPQIPSFYPLPHFFVKHPVVSFWNETCSCQQIWSISWLSARNSITWWQLFTHPAEIEPWFWLLKTKSFELKSQTHVEQHPLVLRKVSLN